MGTHFKYGSTVMACFFSLGLAAAGCIDNRGGSDGAHDAMLSECEAAVDEALGDDCDPGRQCNYEIAKQYCVAGNPEATTEMNTCFRMDPGCHTPADPGSEEVRQCFELVIGGHGTETSAAIRAAADEKCEEDAWEPLMIEVYATMAGAELAEGLQTCVEAAEDCPAITGCVQTNSGVEFPEICGG